MTRRFLAWLMVIAMLVMSIPAYAETAPSVSIAAEGVHYGSDDTVELTTQLSGLTGLVDVEYTVYAEGSSAPVYSWTESEVSNGTIATEFSTAALGEGIFIVIATVDADEDGTPDAIGQYSINTIGAEEEENDGSIKDNRYYLGGSYNLGGWLELLGDEFGIIANEIDQQSHMETNFITKKYSTNSNDTPDLSWTEDDEAAPGKFLMGEFTGSLYNNPIDGGLDNTVGFIYIDESVNDIVDQMFDYITGKSDDVAAGIAAGVYTYIDPLDLEDFSLTNNDVGSNYIDLTGIDADTVIINGDHMMIGENVVCFTLKKANENQTVIFRFENGGTINIGKYNVEVGGKNRDNNKATGVNETADIEKTARETIWDIPNAATLGLGCGNAALTVIAPNATASKFGGNISGWLVVNKVIVDNEWHFDMKSMPKVEKSDISFTKIAYGQLNSNKKFEFKIRGINGFIIPDGTYTIIGPTESTTVTIHDNECDAWIVVKCEELEKGVTVTISGLPAGMEIEIYENTDKSDQGAKDYDISWEGGLPSSDPETGVVRVGTGSTASATCKNNYDPDKSKDREKEKGDKTGELVITKTVVGSLADKEKEFTFRIELSDKTINYTDEYSGVQFVNGVSTDIKLSHFGAITIKGIPAGVTYTVTEVDSNGLQSQSSNANGTITANGTSVAKFTNYNYSVSKGSLNLVKQVVGSDADMQFEFNIDLYIPKNATNPNQSPDMIECKYATDQWGNGTSIYKQPSEMVDKGSFWLASFNVKIKNGQNIVFKNNLPDGTRFEITEVTNASDGFVVDWDYTDPMGKTLVTNNGKSVNGIVYGGTSLDFTCKNIKPVKVPVEGEKFFAEGLTGGKFSFGLYQGTTLLKKITLDGKGKFDFGELTFSKAGTYTYTIKEIVPKDEGDIAYDKSVYTVTIVVSDEGGKLTTETKITKDGEPADAVTFTNGKKGNNPGPEYVQLTVNKVWGDEDDHSNDKVIIDVLDPNGEVVDSIELPQNGSWSHTFTELPKLDEGESYTVAESGAVDGKITVNGTQYDVDVDGTTITNTKTVTVPEYEELTVNKIWADGNVNHGDEDTITIDVLDPNGEVVDSIELPQNGSWSHTFTELPKLDEGESYTVAESGAVDGKITVNGTQYDVDVNGTTITNTKTNVTPTNGSLTVTKTVVGVETNKTFKITITLTLPEGTPEAESYTFGGVEFTYVEGTTYAVTVTLGHEDSVTITGLPEDTTYEVTEEDVSGMGYESTIDGANGTIVAEETQEVEVVNTRKAGSATTGLEATKTLNGMDLENEQFEFVIEAVTAPANPQPDPLANKHVKNDANGKIVLIDENDVFTKVGTYNYTVREVIPAEKAGGMTYDEETYNITVVVSDDGTTATLTAAVTAGTGIEFVNSYSAQSGTASLTGTKNLTGKTIVDGQFEFTITPKTVKAGDPITGTKTVSNVGSTITFFENLVYTQEGEYTYTVSEVIPDPIPAGYTYDENSFEVTVNVTDNKAGQLVTDVTVVGGPIVFNNSYSPKATTVTLDATKVLTYGKLAGDDFTFKLVNTKTGEEYTAKNDENGNITFPTLTFTEADTYTFTVSEVIDNQTGITYDTTVYTVEIVVEDVGGQLKATVKVDDSLTKKIKFNNTKALDPVEESISGTKTYNLALKAGEFTFELTAPDGKTITTSNDENGGFSFGPFKFDKEGEYVYTIREIAGDDTNIAYDGTKYTVTINVTYSEELEKLVTEVVVDGADAVVFENTHALGDLTVTKTVTGTAGDTTKDFTFTVTLSDTSINGEYGDMIFVDGVAEFTLKHGESATATDLPAGITYEVVESDNEGYTVTAAGATGEIVADETVEADFINNRDLVPTPEPTQPTPVVTPDNPVITPEPTPDNSEPTATPEPTPEPTPIPTTNVSGRKTWQDDNNANNTRPASIVVRLLRDGQPIDQVTVTAANGWRYSFNNLPLVDENGREYTYSVSEQLVSGYYAVYDGYNITNVLNRIPVGPGDDTTPDGGRIQRTRTPDGNLIRIRTYGTPLGISAGGNPSVDELSDLIELFGYGTPLWGGLLQTGDTMPIYPFIFGGCGLAAIALLLVLEQKRRKQN